MHELDISLLQETELLLTTLSSKSYNSDKKYVQIKSLLVDYKNAARLSRGPDVDRSKYWQIIADELHNKLFCLVGKLSCLTQ